MEKARQGIQGIGRMLFTQCTEIINPATNRGLPPNLVAEDPGISFIFKGTDLNIASLTAELGFLANPVNHVQTAEMGNQSLNSLALISARYTHTANDVLSQLMATHLIAVCQALDLRALHIQFLELYRPQFLELVAEHYVTQNQPNLPSSSQGQLSLMSDTVPNSSNPSDPSANLSNLEKAWVDHQSTPSKPAAIDELSDLLWSQLLISFDMTASMDAEGRFVEIAKSLRPVLLDCASVNTDEAFVTRMRSFTDALGHSLKDAWCTHRDAYLIHGDATALLGDASKTIYTFLRRTLKVPLLATARLLTPRSGDLEDSSGVQDTQAPTVGSYTGAVYRALRDGTLAKVAVDVLKASIQ
jgi:phenylalanine ammonia-lyase